MAQLKSIEGSAAAITGAASGIGRALALAFAERGCDVAVADKDIGGLKSLADEIERSGRRCVVSEVDVAKAEDVAAFARTAVAALPGLNIVINNAGVALMGGFDEFEEAQMQWLMNINFWGVVRGTRAFLPHLERQPWAHIVNLSSIFGIIAPPGQCAYAASKFAVRGFSEALRHELSARHSPVRLSVVHPGGVATNIARNAEPGANLRERLSADEVGARFAQVARTTPAGAAAQIIRGIERNEPRILIGGDARLMDFMQRLRPARYWALMARGLERLSGPRQP